ncbi:MAG: sensor domain-containing diguanylate cyclase [Coriobacteriales bacterium]|nr:sensor domain-containing diguanylate cyclase [Coriobacteriales bacterium]
MERTDGMFKSNMRLKVNVALAAVSMIVILLVLGWYLHSQLIDNLKSNTELMFSTVYDEINQEFESILDTSRAMSANSFLIDSLQNEESTNPEKFKTKITDYLSSLSRLGNWSTMYVVSDKTMNYYLPDGKMKTLHPENDPWDCWYTLLADSTDEYHVDVDVDKHNTGAWTIFVDTRICDKDGKTLGVSGVGMDLNRVLSIAEHYTSSYGMSVSFVSADGSVRIGSGEAEVTAAKRNVASEEQTEAVGEMVGGSYTVSRYLPLIGWYVVVENAQDSVGDSLKGLLAIVCLVLVALVVIMVIVNTRMFSHERKVLAKRAVTDPLTGLFNRSGLEQQISSRLTDMAAEKSLAACFIIIDLDHFKDINDTFGHEEGDEVLQEFGAMLRAQFRDSDITGRLGGDEFVVFLPSLSDVEIIERKMRDLRNCCRMSRSQEGGRTVVVTMSAGVARSPEQGTSYEELYHTADAALYKAKKNGRDCYELA